MQVINGLCGSSSPVGSNSFDPTGKAMAPKVADDFKLRKVG